MAWKSFSIGHSEDRIKKIRIIPVTADEAEGYERKGGRRPKPGLDPGVTGKKKKEHRAGVTRVTG